VTSPFFSVIIPTYNRADVLPRAIESVLNQTFSDFEIIVVDDGSDDDTKNVVANIHSTLLCYHYQQNKGVCAARNSGASAAKGEYLIFLDSDDVLAPGALNNFFEAMQQEPDVVHGNVRIIKHDGSEKIKTSRDPYETGINTNMGIWLTGSFCIKREIFLRAGGYDPNISFGENTELFWRLSDMPIASVVIDAIAANIYRSSLDRDSTNPGNLIRSLRYVMDKHQSYFNRSGHVKWLYLNKLGVAYLRNKEQLNSIKCFVKSIVVKPFRYKSYLRLGAALINYRYQK
jgi:glycosyltransferase involved in cell wall biosynthesis